MRKRINSTLSCSKYDPKSEILGRDCTRDSALAPLV